MLVKSEPSAGWTMLPPSLTFTRQCVRLTDGEQRFLSTVLSHLEAVGRCRCDNYSTAVGRSQVLPFQCVRLVDCEERLCRLFYHNFRQLVAVAVTTGGNKDGGGDYGNDGVDDDDDGDGDDGGCGDDSGSIPYRSWWC